MKKTLLRSIFAAIVLCCATLPAIAQEETTPPTEEATPTEPIVVEPGFMGYELYEYAVGTLVRINDLNGCLASLYVEEGAESELEKTFSATTGFLQFGKTQMQTLYVQASDALLGTTIPYWGTSCYLIGTVQEGSEGGNYISITELVITLEPSMNEYPLYDYALGTKVQIKGLNGTDKQSVTQFNADDFVTFMTAKYDIVQTKASADLVGTNIPLYGTACNIIGTVQKGGDYGFHVLISEIILPPTIEPVNSNYTIPSPAYVGEKSEFSITLKGSNLPDGNIDILLVSDDDDAATYEFTVTSEDEFGDPVETTTPTLRLPSTAFVIDEENGSYGADVTFTITPSKASVKEYTSEDFWGDPVTELASVYKLQFKLGDELVCETALKPFLVKAAEPAITVVGTEFWETAVYTDTEYTATVLLEPNKFITAPVTLSYPDGSIITKLSAQSFTKEEVEESGFTFYSLDVTFKATTVGEQTISITVQSGDYQETFEVLTVDILTSSPELTIGGSWNAEQQQYIYGVNGNVYVGTPFTKMVQVSANSFVTDDIVFAPKNADDNITFGVDGSEDTPTPTLTVNASLAKDEDDPLYVIVTIIPAKEASREDKPQFPFTIKSGEIEINACVQVNFGIAPNPSTALENAQVEVKATKVIENGQIFILKNGVKYNVLGTVVE